MRRARLIAALAICAAVTAGGARAAMPGVPSMYVTYNVDCTFTLQVDPNTTITSTSAPGTVLPPGTYDLQTAMQNPNLGYSCGKPSFSLTGPGLNVSIVFPGQGLNDERLITLQASGTYVADDANSPTTTQKVFSTSATGSSASLLPTTTTPAIKTGSSQSDIVGSGIVPYRGKLTATVSAAGKATLHIDGRTVGSLKPGKYDIAVDDLARSAGFSIERSGHKPMTITSKTFVGKKTVRVTLDAGSWSYFAKAGAGAYFKVT